MSDLHVQDTGTVFELTVVDAGVAIDLSQASAMTILFRKPSGELMVKDAEYVSDGADGKIQYITTQDDLDERGKWLLQGRVALPTGAWSTSIESFVVQLNLDSIDAE
jgi:hypothetical protein